MEIHTQTCQSCSSEQMKNILYREMGEPDRVYVQCLNCGAFVASYVIAPMGYYHHGKGYESFLRGVNRSGGFMSGRRVKRIFLEKQDGELESFKQVLAQLEQKQKSGLEEE